MIMDSEEIEALQAENEKLRRQRADLTRLHNQNHPNKTSFIFELLQNADDALGQIDAKNSEVKLTLQEDKFTISHYGKPFDQDDVDSICDACRSTKSNDENTIGKFGIGFKLVGVFTNSPQIFSGDKSFEIKDLYEYFPIKPLADLAKGETRIILPFENPDDAFTMIKDGLNKLRARDILFLRHIKALEWQVEGDVFRITQEEKRVGMVRWVTITEHDGTKEKWLIFSQGEDTKTRVEIAFLLKFNQKDKRWYFTPCEGGKTLYCYFHLASQQTDLKFLVQGAFKTIPSRAELAEDDHNNTLIERASELLIEILFWFKKHKALDWGIFDFLPLEDVFFDGVFDSEHLFSPMAEKIRDTLRTEKLLPTNRDFITVEHAILSNDDQLKEIFHNKKISEIFGNKKLYWLKAVSSDKVKGFLTRRLRIQELSIHDIMDEKYITEAFMEDQKDKWIQDLYTLLNEIDKFDKLKKLPLIRLKSNKHICSHDQKDEPQVYLSSIKHSEIIKPETIKEEAAEAFIKRLGIGNYNDIDGFIDEMQGRYNQPHAPDISEEQYKNDIKKIIEIQNNDKIDKDKKRELSDIRFVKAKNMKTGKMAWKRPNQVYLYSENFSILFQGVYICLSDEEFLLEKKIQELLINYGAKNSLQLQRNRESHVKYPKLIEMYKQKHDEYPRKPLSHTDFKIIDLNHIVNSFTTQPETKQRAKALWDALRQMQLDSEKFEANSYYTYHSSRRVIRYKAEFVDTLNNTKWIPAPDGTLQEPKSVVFDGLNWDDDKLLRKHIIFKPSDRDEKLRAVDLTEDGHGGGKIYQELLEKEKKGMPLTDNQKTLLEAMKVEYGKESQPSPKKIPPENPNTPTKQAPPQPIEMPPSSAQLGGVEIFIPDDRPSDTPESSDGGEKPPSPDGPRPPPTFNNFPDDKGDAVAKTHIEQKAIAEVQKRHRNWIDANDEHPNNPGYDFYEPDEEGNPYRWIEVKGLKGGHIGDPDMSGLQRGFALGLRAVGEGNRYIHITVAYADTENPKIRYYYNPTAENHRRIDEDEEE